MSEPESVLLSVLVMGAYLGQKTECLMVACLDLMMVAYLVLKLVPYLDFLYH